MAPSKEKRSSPKEKPSSSQPSASSTSPPMTLDRFVSTMLPLIDLEKEAEIAASLDSITATNTQLSEKRGFALLNLKCADVQTGLLGKTLLELQPNRGELLPPHKLSSHDVVILKPNKAESSSSPLGQGIVYRVKDTSVIVAVDDVPEDGLNSPLRLEKVANEVTYRRLKDTLTLLSKGIQKGPAVELVPVLFGSSSPLFNKSISTFYPFNASLDSSQRQAVLKALSCTHLMLLHGPPGTGKTTAVVEIILQEVKRGRKVLACAASNIAVDNMVERLSSHKIKLVRMGHPARLLPQVLEKALDAQVMKADNSALANDVKKEMKALNNKLLKTKDRRSRGDIRKELRHLAKEERQRQQQAVSDVIKDSSVVLTTLTGSLSYQLQAVDFDVIVIDEAAQALEVACWMAILKGSRCILVGDHLQLAPTVQSVDAERRGLGKTLFARLTELYGDTVTSMLTVQYRMNHRIMDWSSQELYSSKLEAHASVADHCLYELEGVKQSSATEAILVIIDTAGCDMEEKKDEEDSTMNEGEAKVALAHAKRLVESGVNSTEIGIITPYAAQVGLLKIMRGEEKVLKDLEISTVDGFQGREKEAIIISMVRSNNKQEVGFLRDERRMNVAVTRARRHCCLVCDTETVSSHAFLKRLVKYFEETGEYLSASEYVS